MKILHLSAVVLISVLLGACGTPHHELVSAQRGIDTAAAQALVAGAPADEHLPEWLASQRERLSAAREAATQRFADEEKACWHRFMVNACLRDATDARRAALDRLRQEELAVNDLERKRRAANRLRDLEQKQREKS
ncbi:hypothetical protein [Ottowia thiooxydans]|uniref:hypothetical protein n=1 Tax=Ottowia thiooxydans TaxID=219182 RepID=UPI0004164FF4|nr:hypothetical protein [Ottowia thiooxydans]